MRAYAGIDLYPNNNYLGIINENDQRLFKKRLPNELRVILQSLHPFREALVGIVVESTYNWYWLVDDLQGKIRNSALFLTPTRLSLALNPTRVSAT